MSGSIKKGPEVQRRQTLRKKSRNHAFWMARALALARRGRGLTRPNPPVGAVIVRNGRLVGQGWHRQAGGPHAEILALRAAGARARGAALYVTLEPCRTFGRTPPCTQAILAAGIRRVVMAARDPNPRHRGRGRRILRRAGIDVLEGIGADEARNLIVPFAKWIVTGRPYVTLKLALTLDGKIADVGRRSRWITGAASRRAVQELRRQADVILVGAGTVAADDPSLLPKPSQGRKPWRVIVDARGRVAASARVLADKAAAQTVMATTRQCPRRRWQKWQRHGARVWILPAAGRGVSLPALMRKLGRLGMLQVLCEGGSELAAALIRNRLVDDYIFFIAPRVLGGPGPVPAVGGRGWPLAAAPKLIFTECRKLGQDILIRAKPRQTPNAQRPTPNVQCPMKGKNRYEFG